MDAPSEPFSRGAHGVPGQGKWVVTIPPIGAARETALGAARAFEQMGVECFCFDYGSSNRLFTQLMPGADETTRMDVINQSLVVQALDHGSTAALITALTPVTLFSLNLMRRYGVRTIHWFFEDYRRADYWREVIRGYDLFCAIQRGEVQQACAAQGIPFALLPQAAPPAPSPPPPWEERSVDVAFVGVPSSYRATVLEALHREGLALVIAGDGWGAYHGPLDACIVHRGWCPPAVAAQVYARARTGINLSFSQPSPARTDEQISPRVFELAQQGVAVVTEEAGLLSECIGEMRVATFGCAAEAPLAVRALLDSPRQTCAMVRHNLLQATRNHTYESRMRTLLAWYTQEGNHYSSR